MKRRLLAVIAAATMACGMLAGCGGSAATTTTAAGAAATTAKAAATTAAAASTTKAGAATTAGSAATTKAAASAGGSQKITMIMALRDEWLSQLEEAAKANCPSGVSFDTQDAQNDAAKQLQQVEAAKNAGASAIIVNLVDVETAAQMKQAAGGLPVVFVNRYPSDTSIFDDKCVYVGSDEMTSGKFQGEWLTKYFKDKGKTDIKYVLMNGTLGQNSTANRTASVLQALKDGGINATEATAPLACDFDRAKAQDKFTPLIGTTDYDCVISNNDAMALGVIEALSQKGKDPAEKPIVGIDASNDGRQAIKDGKLAMSVFQDPKGQGKGAIQAAMNMVNGNDIAKDTGFEKDSTGHILWVPFEPVTPENVKDYDNR